jgi:hypothetical protein
MNVAVRDLDLLMAPDAFSLFPDYRYGKYRIADNAASAG